MRRFAPTAVALLGAALLQAGLAPHLAVFGVFPNLLLLVVVTLALTQGPTAGAVAGFAAGFLFDLLGSGPIGPAALVMCVVGYTAGMLLENLFAEGWLLPVTVVLAASLTAELAYGAVRALLEPGMPFWQAFLRLIVPGAVYNTALAILIFPWLARLLRHDRPMSTFRRLA